MRGKKGSMRATGSGERVRDVGGVGGGREKRRRKSTRERKWKRRTGRGVGKAERATPDCDGNFRNYLPTSSALAISFLRLALFRPLFVHRSPPSLTSSAHRCRRCRRGKRDRVSTAVGAEGKRRRACVRASE